MRFRLSEHQHLRSFLIFQIVPFVRGVVVDLQILRGVLLEDDIGCRQIGGFDTGGIAEGEGPIA